MRALSDVARRAVYMDAVADPADAAVSAPPPPPILSPAAVVEEMRQALAGVLNKEPKDLARAVQLLLAVAIRSGAVELRLDLLPGRIQVKLRLGNSWLDCATVADHLWGRILEEIQRRSGVDPSSTTWPQVGRIGWQAATLLVTITRATDQEAVSIEIPPGAAGAHASPEAPRSSTKKRTRFWT